MIRDRKERPGFVRKGVAEALPPHSDAAEQGVLGCIMLEAGLVAKAAEWFHGKEVFYDLKHALIFKRCLECWEAGKLDLIILQQLLKDKGELDQVGGVAFLASLPDAVPSAANIEYYLKIVWEKFIARRTIQTTTSIRDAVLEQNGIDEAIQARMAREMEQLQHDAMQGGEITPKYLKQPTHFQDECFAHFFRDPLKGDPGYELPIKFPFKIRRKECSLISADDGAGKSTVLSYFALHLANQEPGVCVASFEEPPGNSLWRLASQLVGKKHLPDSDAGRSEAINALGWLNQRFWFYDFLGISDWRDVLDTFRYAAEKHGAWLFILDSVMRIGIPDDDYAQQANAAAAFAQFAMDFNAHLIFVIHENKADSKGKAKIRGSKLWSANANNVLQVERNMDKAEKSGKTEWSIRTEEMKNNPDQTELRELRQEMENLNRQWDTHLVLRKQRLSGTQQNASKRFWFDRNSFQFRDHWEDPAQNFLKFWKKRKEDE